LGDYRKEKQTLVGLGWDHTPNHPEDGTETGALKPSTPLGANHGVQGHGLHNGNKSDQNGNEGAKMGKQGGDNHAKTKQQGV